MHAQTVELGGEDAGVHATFKGFNNSNDNLLRLMQMNCVLTDEPVVGGWGELARRLFILRNILGRRT